MSQCLLVCRVCCLLGLQLLSGFAAAEPFAYIANRDDDTVSVIDTATDTVVSTIAVGDYPQGLAVTPDGARVFVANQTAGTVSVIDTVTRAVIATIPTGLAPTSVAMDPSGALAYVVNNGDDRVSIIDTATLAVSATLQVNDAPERILTHPNQARAYVMHKTSANGLSLSVIDTQTRTVVNTLAVGVTLADMVLHPDGNTLILVDEPGRSLLRVDLTTLQITSTVVLSGDPYGVAVSPGGSAYYVTDLQRQLVLEVDAVTHLTRREIVVGNLPKGIQLHPDGKRLYVSNADSSSVSIIDIASAIVTSTVNVGLGPVGTGRIFSPQSIPATPNVILFVADDMREDDMAHMPILQSLLVGSGIKFTDAFAVNATCCPARAAILRGQYPRNSGVTRVGDGFERFHSSGKELDTLATRLRNAGYRTGLYGKYFVDYPQRNDLNYMPPGWDEWAAAKGYFDYEMVENGVTNLYGSAPEEYLTDVLSAKVQASIARAQIDKRPFFLYVTPFAPHSPAIPAPRHAALFADLQAPRPSSFDEVNVSDKPLWVSELSRINAYGKSTIDDLYRNRLRSLQALDEMVGAVIASVQSVGEMDNTYIIFTSDQGFMRGEHRLRSGKGNAYEESINVPFVVRGPGVSAGLSSASMVLHTDIMPTLLAIAGISAPDYVDGRSLLPLFGGGEPTPWRSRFLVDHTDTPLIDLATPTPSHQAVRTKRYTYVEYPGTGEHELYDLNLDPYQLNNTYPTASASVLQDLAADLAALKLCAGAACAKAENGQINYTLTAAVTGAGVGKVASGDGLINCGADCTEAYASGALVTLTATPDAGSRFSAWSGACRGTANTCTVTLDAVRSVTANFALTTYKLTVSKQGAGSGLISTTDSLILCGADCTENYVPGNVVTLTATPGSGSSFGSWGANICPGAGSCSVTMNAAKTLQPTFVIP